MLDVFVNVASLVERHVIIILENPVIVAKAISLKRYS